MPPLIRPFQGLRPPASLAQAVLAPPYDVLDTAEARRLAGNNPLSFLHVSKPEIDLPDGTELYSAAVYAQGAKNFRALIDGGTLHRDPAPYYYVYRLTMGERVQTGLVAVVATGAYDADRVRKHEFTRPDKEQDRTRHIETLRAQTGPVFLVNRADAELSELLAQQAAGDAEVDAVADGGVRHQLWVVRDRPTIDQISGLVDRVGVLYIADGHHRAAAAARVAAAERRRGSSAGASQHFLAVIFPHDEVRILDYNRVVKDLNGMAEADLLAAIAATGCILEPCAQGFAPARPREFGLYLGKQWHRLTVPLGLVPEQDPVRRLDVSLLHDLMIEPLLGIGDPRRDRRIDFVGGIRGLAELERRVDSGEMAVAFALFPTALEDLMAVADTGQAMPPKSTWFEPKLADGMVSHLLD